jgi:hypothetical protein
MLNASVACLAIVLSQSGTHSEAEYSIESDAFGQTYWSYVFREQLDKTPPWEGKAENPPLSVRRAMELAEKEVARVRAEDGLNRLVDQVALVPVRDRWIWQVTYVWKVKAGGSTGVPDHYHVLVLMDGSVIKPVVHRESR